jgi:hypothetical protein
MARARRRAGAAPSWSSRPTLTRTPTPPAAAEGPSGKQALGSKLAGLGTGIVWPYGDLRSPQHAASSLERERIESEAGEEKGGRRRGKKKVAGGEGKGGFDWPLGVFAFRSAGCRALPCLCYSTTSSACSLPGPKAEIIFLLSGGAAVGAFGSAKLNNFLFFIISIAHYTDNFINLVELNSLILFASSAR